MGVDSGSQAGIVDPLSDSRVSFDEGLTGDLHTHSAALERVFQLCIKTNARPGQFLKVGQLVHGCRRGLTVLPCRKVTSDTLVKTRRGPTKPKVRGSSKPSAQQFKQDEDHGHRPAKVEVRAKRTRQVARSDFLHRWAAAPGKWETAENPTIFPLKRATAPNSSCTGL
ncbi:hypothetical protein J6590_061124 [Homalodisca vitripennis]|nr:hypothetical protein J6590_061124 [Homalodisca vitripennis]